MKFRAAQNGYITGIRFYKATANTGTHTGDLWTSTGTRLGQVTFTNETASGWQQASFSSPIAVTANTTYVASYHAPNGRYSTSAQYFANSATIRGPLTALQNGTDGGNGVYSYGPAGSFPNSTYQSENYWVDVVFETSAVDTTKPTVVTRTPASGATDAPVSSPVTAQFSEAVTASTVAMTLKTAGGATVAGTTTYAAGTTTATFTPTAALSTSTTYTATVSGAKDTAGNTMDTDSWTFSTAGPAGACPCSIWASSATPTTTQSETRAVELGVKFRATQNGFINGIRFYKSAQNTGTHVGSLWTGTGTRLGQVTFTNESASGWQQASFATPIAVTANTTYVASYHAPNGRYSTTSQYFATSPTTRGPLTALQNGTDGSNGVYRYGAAGNLPNSSFQSTNYWVDVSFDTSQAPDTQKPTVVGRTPAAGATDVAPGTTVTGQFSEPVVESSITMRLTAPSGNQVTASTSYSSGSNTVTLTPLAALAANTTYTASLSGAKDAAGNTMDPVTWTFTTSATVGACPCTIWPSTATPAGTDNDNSSVEIGVKFRAAQNGYITGIRFYKATANTGTHTGDLWTSTGTRLGQVTFTNETASGWQQASFASPIAVTANTTYVASYHAPNGRYSTSSQYFANSATTRGPLTALQNGTDGGNAVYSYGSAGSFPNNTYEAENYWVDVVFETTAVDNTKPTVVTRTPATGATDVPVSSPVTAQFSEAVTASTVAMTLKTAGGATVAGTTAYQATSNTATFTPAAALTPSSTYTATVSGAKDAAGNTMDTITWTFDTQSPPPPPVEQGPGGRIAVVTNTADPTSKYLTEIMRAEGLNEFTTMDAADLSALNIGLYDVVVLSATELTSSQVSAVTTWVNAGGNLIAMRPSNQLSSLLGITSSGGTTSNGYLAVDASTGPGAGITTDTMQYHGTAGNYGLAGAQQIARLYSSATAATAFPAVTLNDVGSSGGQAAGFAYDLATSVVQTRQGNPAWAGQERDGSAPIRSDDQYFGGAQADWVNLDKVFIPQADEQQRLLANLITVMNRDRMPVPRFWYFPDQHKAVVVATGDDHAQGGTAGRFDTYKANSPAGCSVADWTCPRFTSYIYPDSPLSSGQATSYVGEGFEVALHEQNGCRDFTSLTDLQGTYNSTLAQWRAKYSGIASPKSNRFHCLVWSDWASQAKVEAQLGMRYDANYYYWPSSWIQNRPGFMNGSGVPMRYTDNDGSLIDVYQGMTVMTDESGQNFPFTADTLISRAKGPLGYYGALTVNMHTDTASTFESNSLLQSAQAAGVPVITAKQMLTWLDGRNSSSFKDTAWDGSAMTFTTSVGTGANRLTVMLPTAGPSGRVLSSITRAGSPVPFTTSTIKGQEYALFPAGTGTFRAAYDTVQPLAMAARQVDAVGVGRLRGGHLEDGPPATGALLLGTKPGSLDETEAVGGLSERHSLTADDLDAGRTYFYRVRSKDGAGNVRYWPVRALRPPGSPPLRTTARPPSSVAYRWLRCPTARRASRGRPTSPRPRSCGSDSRRPSASPHRTRR